MQIFNAKSLGDVSNLKSGMTEHMYMKSIITPRKVVFLRCLHIIIHKNESSGKKIYSCLSLKIIEFLKKWLKKKPSQNRRKGFSSFLYIHKILYFNSFLKFWN